MKKLSVVSVLGVVAGIFAPFLYNISYNEIPIGLVLSILLILFIALFVVKEFGRRNLCIYSGIVLILILIFSSYGPFGDDIIILGNIKGLIFVILGSIISPSLLFFNKKK